MFIFRWHKTSVYNKKEDTSSLKVSIESVLITAAAKAREVWDVAAFDIPGEYLHTETDKDVIILMEVTLDELTVKVSTNIYQKYAIMINKRKPLLYFQMKRRCMAYYAVCYCYK